MKNLFLSKKSIAFLFLISSMMYIGCQREDLKSEDHQKEPITQTRSVPIPTVENGTLKFDTEDDAFNYLVFLADELQNESNNILESQAALGFTSRLKIVTDLGEGNENGSIFRAPHLNAMLNSNYEIIIGDKVYTNKNHEETWIANVSDLTSLAVFRAKEPGSFINDAEITSNMIIDGKKEALTDFCCTRFGVFPKSDSRVHQGNTIKLDASVEVKKGFFGIYVWAKAIGLRNNRKSSDFNLEARVWGKFRDNTCEVKYTDYDEDFCTTCSSKAVNIFHRVKSRNKFKDFDIKGTLKLFFTSPGQPIWIDIFPSCT